MTKYLIFIGLLLIACSANGQDIEAVGRKLSFPDNLPIPRFVIALPDSVNGISLRVNDLKSITPQKLNQVKEVEYAEICFSNQDELNELMALLKNFQNLKYISFSDNKFQTETSLDTIVIPSEIANFKHIKAIKFGGEWKIDYDKSFVQLIKLPDFNYAFFENISQDIPVGLLQFKRLKGLSIYNNNSNKFPNWIVGFKDLESLAIGLYQYKNIGENYPDYSSVLKTLTQLPNLKSLFINSLYNLKEKYDDVVLKKLEKLVISTGTIKQKEEFFKFISNNKKITDLKLALMGLDTLNSNLLKLKSLKSLTLSGTNSELYIGLDMKEFGKLERLKFTNFKRITGDLNLPTSLRYLDLGSNNLEELPSNIGELKNLEALNVNYNSLKNFPVGLANLENLDRIDMSNNKLTSLSENIDQLKNLKDLNLMANPLKALPVSIVKLSKLRNLDLSFCDVTTLPEDFGNLKQLKVLKMEGNFLSSLPESFSNLENLTYADFNLNYLNKLPTNIGFLTNLAYLNLGFNYIEELPLSIGALKSLRQLYLNENNLKSLPKELGNLTSIQEVYFSNALGTNQQYDNIRQLYRKDIPSSKREIAQNTFHNLPIDLSNWINLKSIRISNHTTLSQDSIFKALFSIPAKGFSVELENSNITSLPTAGWSNFNVGTLNLRSNKITAIPSDIINAPYLVSFNFNNNSLPSKPVNLNAYAADKYQKLLWFTEFGFIKMNDLPKVDSMVFALVEKSSNHYYRKEFKQAVNYANLALDINKKLALTKIFKGNLGEANYEVGNYKEAIDLFTIAIRNDTAGGIRIMNFVIPDFTFRAKSYLKLGDTLSAIKDYETLAVNNWDDTWAEVGLLYLGIKDKKAAKKAFDKGIEKYQIQIDYGKKHKSNVELLQLSLLEQLIVAEEFSEAENYAKELKTEIKGTANLTLLDYLDAAAKIALNKANSINEKDLLDKIGLNKKNISSWSFELFFKWLRITQIGTDKANQIRKITDAIKP